MPVPSGEVTISVAGVELIEVLLVLERRCQVNHTGCPCRPERCR
jgi:hypothetical protein